MVARSARARTPVWVLVLRFLPLVPFVVGLYHLSHEPFHETALWFSLAFGLASLLPHVERHHRIPPLLALLAAAGLPTLVGWLIREAPGLVWICLFPASGLVVAFQLVLSRPRTGPGAPQQAVSRRHAMGTRIWVLLSLGIAIPLIWLLTGGRSAVQLTFLFLFVYAAFRDLRGWDTMSMRWTERRAARRRKSLAGTPVALPPRPAVRRDRAVPAPTTPAPISRRAPASLRGPGRAFHGEIVVIMLVMALYFFFLVGTRLFRRLPGFFSSPLVQAVAVVLAAGLVLWLVNAMLRRRRRGC